MNTLQRKQEMAEIADNLLQAINTVLTYPRLCMAEDYVSLFKLEFEDVEEAGLMVWLLKNAIERRRSVVRLYDKPKGFDWRYFGE